MRKIQLITFVAAALFAATGMQAQGPWTSNGCTVTLADGVLTVSPIPGDLNSGKTGSYSDDASGLPWKSYRSLIRSIVVEEGVKVIGSACFHTCPNVNSVSLPSTLTEIGYRAFYKCSSLTSITIPAGVYSIGGQSFRGCTSLAEVTIMRAADGLTWSDGNCRGFMGEENSKTTICYVPVDQLSAFNTKWNNGTSSDINVTFACKLDDNTDISSSLSTLAGMGALSGIAINRPFYKDGKLNTLCLPFGIASFTGTPLEGAEVYEYVSAEKTEQTLDINIRPVDAVAAGVPYLVSWADGDDMSSMTFRGVTVTATAPETVSGDAVGDDIKFIGTLAPAALTSDEKYLFVGANNTLYYPSAAGSLKGFRAYFRVDGLHEADPEMGSGAPARFVILPKTPTGVDNAQTDEIRSTKVIENGRVVILRNGVRYNAAGQMMK